MRGLLLRLALIATMVTMAGVAGAQPNWPQPLSQPPPQHERCPHPKPGQWESCLFDASRFYDSPTEPTSTVMYTGGLVVVGLGAAMSLVGIPLLWVDGAFFAAVHMIPHGALLSLTVGAPLAVIGGRRDSRTRSATVRLQMKPAGAVLLGTF